MSHNPALPSLPLPPPLDGLLLPLQNLGSGATGIVFLARHIPSHPQSPSPPDHELPPLKPVALELLHDAHLRDSSFTMPLPRPSDPEAPRASSDSREIVPSPGDYVDQRDSDDDDDDGSEVVLFAVKAFRRTRDKDRDKSENEEQILRLLKPNPYLPRLHAAFDLADFRLLVLDFCAGGDLHSLRFTLPDKRFTPMAIRFYAAEIIVALEHLHKQGVVYRDLKPENVLLRESGHVVLADFDLSGRLEPLEEEGEEAKLETNADEENGGGKDEEMLGSEEEEEEGGWGCGRWRARGNAKKKVEKKSKRRWVRVVPVQADTSRSSSGSKNSSSSSSSSRKKSAEGDAEKGRVEEEEGGRWRRHSFVGTEEYVAPEVIKGEGHGYAVDWWALGVLLYEMAYGRTPFMGAGKGETFRNIVNAPLVFPGAAAAAETMPPPLPEKKKTRRRRISRKVGMMVPPTSTAEKMKIHSISSTPQSMQMALLRDVISKLLTKDPLHRPSANQLRAHPFFQGLRWDALQCVARPPFLPRPYPAVEEDHHHVLTASSTKTAAEPLMLDVLSHLDAVDVAREECRALRRRQNAKPVPAP